MKLRLYRQADTEGPVHLFTSSVHTLGAAHYDDAQRHAWAPIPADIDAWRHRFAKLRTLVAVDHAGDDGAYLGFLSSEADGHIDLLYVAPAAARRGVASALLCTAATHLSTVDGVTDLFTEASVVAVPLFQRHGFRIVEEQTITRRGVPLRRFAMRAPVDRFQTSACADRPPM